MADPIFFHAAVELEKLMQYSNRVRTLLEQQKYEEIRALTEQTIDAGKDFVKYIRKNRHKSIFKKQLASVEQWVAGSLIRLSIFYYMRKIVSLTYHGALTERKILFQHLKNIDARLMQASKQIPDQVRNLASKKVKEAA